MSRAALPSAWSPAEIAVERRRARVTISLVVMMTHLYTAAVMVQPNVKIRKILYLNGMRRDERWLLGDVRK